MKEKTASAVEARAKRPSIIRRTIQFFREVFQELSKVVTPTRRELMVYSIVVFVFVLIVLGIVALLDWVFAFLVTFVFGGSSPT